MTTKELLSRAEDYIAQYTIDLNEAKFGGCSDEETARTYEYFYSKLAGMTQLMSQLYRILEEEEEE